jgi:hypothetical protein
MAKNIFTETILVELASVVAITEEDLKDIETTLVGVGFVKAKVLGTALVSEVFTKQFADERLKVTIPPAAIAILEEDEEAEALAGRPVAEDDETQAESDFDETEKK